jgi:hypothetical protein
MMITPQELLDTTIAQLRTLVAFLEDQLGASNQSQSVALETRACREIMHALTDLLRKLQAARHAKPTPHGNAWHEGCEAGQ